MGEDMNKSMAWTIAGVGRRTRDAAEEAARRAGMRLDDWLGEAIADQAGFAQRNRPDENELEDQLLDAAAGRLERIARRNEGAREPPTPGIPDSFDLAIERFEARLSRAEARAARAFESVAEILERSNAARDDDRQALIDAVRRLEAINGRPSGEGQTSEGAPAKPRLDLKAAVSQIAMRRQEMDASLARVAPDSDSATPMQSPHAKDEFGAPAEVADSLLASPLAESLRDDIRAVAQKLDDLRGERSDPAVSAGDLGALRAEIAAMNKSLVDLAPRNAIVALEGAIRDLMQRVETARRDGRGDSLLIPLEAMAAELRAAVKTHDPRTVAAGLERELRAIGGKIDSLAATAIKPETFERIRRQTEEVRNLLASAALRTAPLERMERRIGELADRMDQLGASSAPHLESAEVAAFLAEARGQIERSTRPEALLSIERRLEEIAARTRPGDHTPRSSRRFRSPPIRRPGAPHR